MSEEYLFYYFSKMLCECSEMLNDMEICEVKRDELRKGIQNVVDKLNEWVVDFYSIVI